MKRTGTTGTPALVLDILATDGGWLTGEGVALLLPDVKPGTVATALWRLFKAGLVEQRSIEAEPFSRSEWRGL